MVTTIRVQFADGSGWLFTQRQAGGFWDEQTIKDGEVQSDAGIIANDTRLGYITNALHYGSDLTITKRTRS